MIVGLSFKDAVRWCAIATRMTNWERTLNAKARPHFELIVGGWKEPAHDPRGVVGVQQTRRVSVHVEAVYPDSYSTSELIVTGEQRKRLERRTPGLKGLSLQPERSVSHACPRRDSSRPFLEVPGGEIGRQHRAHSPSTRHPGLRRHERPLRSRRPQSEADARANTPTARLGYVRDDRDARRADRAVQGARPSCADEGARTLGPVMSINSICARSLAQWFGLSASRLCCFRWSE
jgi:hypothetical protein